MFGKREIFRDVGPELSEAERHRAIRTAGTLARQRTVRPPTSALDSTCTHPSRSLPRISPAQTVRLTGTNPTHYPRPLTVFCCLTTQYIGTTHTGVGPV